MELQIDGGKAWIYTGGKPFDRALPTVVFIHGAEHDHSVWALQSRYLAHHGYGVLAVDLPGHGRSQGAPLRSIETIADWLAALLAALDVAPATLIGHSMGSLVAIECAARHPQRVGKLVLVGTTLPMRVADDLLTATRDNEAAAQSMVNLWSHAALAHYPGNPGPGFWVPGVNLRLMQRQQPGVMQVDFAACNAYDNGLPACAAIRCPVLVVLGKRDQMTPPRSAGPLLRALEKRAADDEASHEREPAPLRVVEIDAAGHAIMAEKPDELLDAIRSFLL